LTPIPARNQLNRLRKAELLDLLDQIRGQEAETLGPIVVEVARALAEVTDMAGFDRARGSAALALASQLDVGAGLATAGIAKELRSTLMELELAAKERNGADTDPAEDLDAELARLTAS
jgi:hypothetical protein